MGEAPVASLKRREKWYYRLRFLLINQVIAECFTANNMFLISRGEKMLGEIPKIDGDDDTIPYEDVLCRLCMPYGLASLLVMDDDKAKCTALSRQFEELKAKLCPTVFEDIKA